MIKVNCGLFFGYALGALLMYVIFKLNWIFSYVFLRNKKIKLYALFILKTALYFGLVALIIYLMLIIDFNYLVKHSIENPTLIDRFNKPINIFAFSGGLLTSFIAILFTECMMHLKK
ncbi:hypothetical protein [Mycoplasma seminis]|uniref:Uncharacterized protein n=1 Tax=Mycoplasma seminis TaxID=512749 RepID=A0ABY9HBY2_9MOLU|nr:hypothetical protein [Mycoplasma seminis]WLP85873.1 hypothetical protein Q8852_01870 [Mycoplasma seminis]